MDLPGCDGIPSCACTDTNIAPGTGANVACEATVQAPVDHSSTMRGRIVAGAALLALSAGVLSACGGSSKQTLTKTKATPPTTTPAASPTTATTPTASSGPVHATLRGATHTPTAGKPWDYSVHVTDATGKPLTGTVETEFVAPGIGVVGKETPPIHPLKNGLLSDSVTFPAAALGHPLYLVTVVRTSAGSVAVGWSVTVKR